MPETKCETQPGFRNAHVLIGNINDPKQTPRVWFWSFHMLTASPGREEFTNNRLNEAAEVVSNTEHHLSEQSSRDSKEPNRSKCYIRACKQAHLDFLGLICMKYWMSHASFLWSIIMKIIYLRLMCICEYDFPYLRPDLLFLAPSLLAVIYTVKFMSRLCLSCVCYLKLRSRF